MHWPRAWSIRKEAAPTRNQDVANGKAWNKRENAIELWQKQNKWTLANNEFWTIGLSEQMGYSKDKEKDQGDLSIKTDWMDDGSYRFVPGRRYATGVSTTGSATSDLIMHEMRRWALLV